MRRFFIVSLLSNLFLFANNLSADKQPEFPPLIWLVVALLLIGVLFWSFYKALKSRNPKYGYLITLIVLLLGAMLFV
ncbi:MAG: hypothetical protein GXO60_02820 [Epsilonproteobacteria bacterium]|nr:hypothetical protein [Campylobacterota bacterium]